jgi:hypothetical protein
MSIKTKRFNKYGYKSLSIVCDKDEEDYNSFYDHIQDTKVATLHETGNGYIVKWPFPPWNGPTPIKEARRKKHEAPTDMPDSPFLF